MSTSLTKLQNANAALKQRLSKANGKLKASNAEKEGSLSTAEIMTYTGLGALSHGVSKGLVPNMSEESRGLLAAGLAFWGGYSDSPEMVAMGMGAAAPAISALGERFTRTTRRSAAPRVATNPAPQVAETTPAPEQVPATPEPIAANA